MRREFERVAIVNRGEPAMRFIHAARELRLERGWNLRTLALFTEPDAQALFVREADESYSLGPAIAVDGQGRRQIAYLDYGRLERALVDTRAEAVWVGWGFVAEHAAFAELCQRLGVAFIGPNAAVIRRLGDKVAAKRLAEEAGVPVAPSSGGPVASVEAARRHAETIGYPLVIKASAGGGGRGIRKVLAPEELEQAFASARSEALRAFGDPTVFLERMVPGARHVEVQVIADAYGTTWAVGVRDCSVQRRHQKLIEESPAPGLGQELDRELRRQAVRLARAAAYENAGTVEFLVDPANGQACFMEVNTRLQVEHPVTEVTTGLDLVKLQVHVARGGRLEGEPPAPRGHAIEVRLNAEDPDHAFAPAPGRIAVLRFPSGPGLRVDTGVLEGDAVPAEFDPMIAKIVAHGGDRAEALARLERALKDCRVFIRGGATNKAFLMELLAHADFRSGRVDIGWLDRLVARAEPGARRHAEMALVRAAIDAYEAELELERARFYASAARGRPEVAVEIGRSVELHHAGHAYCVGVRRMGTQRYRVSAEAADLELEVAQLGASPLRERRAQDSGWRLDCGGRSHRISCLRHGLAHYVEVDGVPHTFTRDHHGVVRSPSPAIVVSVAVREGDEVAVGDRLLVLEAMKMETSLLAPFAGRVREVLVMSNVQVGAGMPLLIIDVASDGAAAPGSDRLRLQDLAAPAPPPASADERRRVLSDLRSLVLGFDVEPDALAALLTGLERAAPAPSGAAGPPAEELEILDAFVDLCSLFRRQPADQDWNDDVRLSTQEYLFSYLRNLDARGAGLPPGFMPKLLRALRHYGIGELTRSPELEEALFWICKAHQREEHHSTLAFRLLERWLEQVRPEPGPADAELRGLLERLIAETSHRYPSVADLAREVRYRCFERPLLERAREKAYAEVEQHLSRLQADPPPAERSRRIERLVQCPQPLAGLLSGRFETGGPILRQSILEAFIRRYYRIRELGDVRTTQLEGHCVAWADYAHEGRRVHVITTHAEERRLLEAAHRLREIVAQVPDDEDVALDFFLWRPGPLDDPEASSASLRGVLDSAGFQRPIRRVVAVLASPGAEGSVRGTQCFTYRQAAQGFREERVYRGVHPMMAKRLHMGRLSEFELERLASVEDVYVLRGVARGNPRDERLFVMAEVRDLTPVRDETGRLVQLPCLERMLLEALAGIRRFQARRAPGQRLYGNRVLLYVWPVFDLPSDELNEMVSKLAPAADGLGVEAVVLRVRLPQPGGALADKVIEISSPAGRGVVLSLREPSEEPIRPLSEYEQKVVRLAQRGFVYPYEIVRTLTPPVGARSELPPGDFTEYELDGDRLAPVERPFGRNQANVVVGVVRSFTAKHPEGMARVLVLGDPSRELGALAEPECRRLIAALELAEQERIPVDWIALSAGARISMESGTENMDWIARVLRRLVLFTQAGGEVNVVVNGINVGAQPYWNAEATMLMHTRGILVMLPDSAMVLTGKRALEYSGGVSAEDNQGIGGYERVMGPNGQAQYFARDLLDACRLLVRHHEHSYVAPGEQRPRRAHSVDPVERDVCSYAYGKADGHGFALVGEVFAEERNPGRKKPFDIRSVMSAVIDQDHAPLERWFSWQEAETAVVWDAHLGGYPVCLLGIESRPLPRLGFVPADGPDQWTAGTLFPQSSRKLARALNAASGNRPVVVLANLTGFDGSPESLRLWQLEYGAEIGRAVVNFDGPIIFCVISRYHGGAFVVFSNALNDKLRVIALDGTFASVIGGAPAAAVVFAREVDKRVGEDPRIRVLERELALAEGSEKARLRTRLAELARAVHAEKLGETAAEFDAVHSVHRALRVGSVHEIIPPSRLRPRLIESIEAGLAAPAAAAMVVDAAGGHAEDPAAALPVPRGEVGTALAATTERG
jgi:acetyl/propionyl-CoA carboxylase alpha subunit/acetyl-CoA carboxylase carboxyltransferase component